MRIVRLLFAGLVFCAILYGLMRALVAVLPADSPKWLLDAGFVACFVVCIFLTNRLVNVSGTNFWSLYAFRDTSFEELEAEGMIVSTAYKANRTFKVKKLDHEGPHYFIGLDDGTVLYMNGEYLEDFEPWTFLGLSRRARKFPCSDFIVRRHREDGSILDLVCRGYALEPEITFPPFERSDLESNTLPQDGDVITTRTYDELKAARISISQQRER